MTTTVDAIVKEAWDMMARADSPMPPDIACDWLMERGKDGWGCERKEAVDLLREYAAEVYVGPNPSDKHWWKVPDYIRDAITLGAFGSYNIVHDLEWMRRWCESAKQSIEPMLDWPIWEEWVKRAEHAISLLRNLNY